MKGTKTVKVNGEEVAFKFTLGVIEDLQEYAEKYDIPEEELDRKMKHLRVQIALMELYATDAWKEEGIIEKAEKASLKYKGMEYAQMMEITSLMREAAGELG